MLAMSAKKCIAFVWSGQCLQESLSTAFTLLTCPVVAVNYSIPLGNRNNDLALVAILGYWASVIVFAKEFIGMYVGTCAAVSPIESIPIFRGGPEHC
jgi:hypothetical protein